MKDEIIKLCSDIKINNKCSSCGGKFNNHTCIYCGNESEILEKLENKLVSALSNDIILDEDILMALFTIKSLRIEEVDRVLNENNYIDKLKNKYEEICKKVDNNNNLSSDDYKYILYFIDNNIIVDRQDSYFINNLMKDMLLGKLDVSNDLKLTLIKNFTEMFMKGKVRNPKCSFASLNGDTLGKSFYNIIDLDTDAINELLDSKNYVGLLKLIFHECTHTYQTYIREIDKIVSYSNLVQTKENLIRMSFPDYYNQNYIKFSDEVEARYMENALTLQYLNLLNLQLSNSDFLSKSMNEENMLLMDRDRVLNDSNTTVNELFLSLSNDASLLNRYPVLNVEFKTVDGKMVKKTLNEIMEDYEQYKNGNLRLNGRGEDIDFLYDYLIDGMKQNKERS